MAELLSDPNKYRGKRVVVYTDNQSTVTMFQGQKSKKLYMAFFLESLYFILAALSCNLVMKWHKRRSSYPAELSDDATHANFSNALPGTVCARHSLPQPLQETLMTTTAYHSHTLGQLRKKVKLYLLEKCPGVLFPH